MLIVWVMVHFEKLKKEIKKNHQIAKDLLVSLENLISYPPRNTVIRNAVTSPGLETLPQINPTANSMKKRKRC